MAYDVAVNQDISESAFRYMYRLGVIRYLKLI